ncbi:hypothetical protein COCNU_scaffold013553G000010 [Cocos nucifera]|nr:hypothetical protein [Cocos nucifera]
MILNDIPTRTVKNGVRTKEEEDMSIINTKAAISNNLQCQHWGPINATRQLKTNGCTGFARRSTDNTIIHGHKKAHSVSGFLKTLSSSTPSFAPSRAHLHLPERGSRDTDR